MADSDSFSESSSLNGDDDWNDFNYKTLKVKRPIIKEKNKKQKDIKLLQSATVLSKRYKVATELNYLDEELNDLIDDENDRKKFESMTEKEREEEIFNRMEKREAMKARYEIERKIKGENRVYESDDEIEHVPEIDESSTIKNRKSSRKIKGSKEDAINDYKEKRKNMKENKITTTPSTNSSIRKEIKLKVADVFSDEEEKQSTNDNENKISTTGNLINDENWDDKQTDLSSFNKESKQELELSIKNLEKLRISRNLLEKWIHIDNNLKELIGAFVRISIGKSNQKSIYRIAQIIEIVDGNKIYPLGQTKTNKLLNLRHADCDYKFRVEFVSNQPFEISEFNRWFEALKNCGMKVPSISFINSKIDCLNNISERTLTNHEITEIVKKKSTLGETKVKITTQRRKLLIELESAQANNDLEQIKKILNDIKKIDQTIEEEEKKKSETLKNIKYINQKNKRLNDVHDDQPMESFDETTNVLSDDPFTRRKTKPIILTKMDSVFENPVTEASICHKHENTNKSDLNKDSKSDYVDPFLAHDFDIEIDI